MGGSWRKRSSSSAKDLDSAFDLIAMPAIKRGIAIGRLVKPKGASAPVPAAPPPPPARNVANDVPRDTDSDEEWNRKEALRERRLLEMRRKQAGW
jgi:hypothetical protein